MAKSKRRKARRNVTVGMAHIKATFNNTIDHHHRHQGRHAVLGQRRHERLQGKPQEHALRRPDGGAAGAPRRPSKFGMKEVDVRSRGPAAAAKARSPPCRPPA